MAASFYPAHELATRIGGARVASTDLTPLGGQPHGLVPSKQAAAALKRAKVVLYVGGSFQPAVAEAVAALPSGTAKVDLAADAALPAAKTVPGMRGAVEGAGTDRAAADPHAWLDPERFAAMAQQTQAALAGADPEHRAEYDARGGKYAAELTALAAEFERQLTACKQDVILTTHPAWGYLAERYGFKQAVTRGITPGAALDPKSLAALGDYAKQTGATTLFTTVPLPSRQAKAIKEAAGLAVQPLDPVEGLTQDQRAQNATYASIMRSNLATLAASLRCAGAPEPTTPGATTPDATTPAGEAPDATSPAAAAPDAAAAAQ